MAEHRMVSFPLWVQFWGLPLEYHIALVAESLGDVGDIALKDNEISFASHIHYLRVRVHVDPVEPLVQNIRVRLGDNSFVWVDCKYETIFRSCAFCHVIGHTMQDCPFPAGDVFHTFSTFADKVNKMFGSRLVCTFDVREKEQQ